MSGCFAPVLPKDVRGLDIVLTDPHGVYKAGEIAGTVCLDVVSDTKVKGLHLRVHGAARCSWDREEETTHFLFTSSGGSTSCKDTEVYLTDFIYIPQFSACVLEPGRYTYPFSYRLPTLLPSSLEGPHGKVQYWIRCELDRAWPSRVQEVTIPFTVRGILDLNIEPHLRLPRQEATRAASGTWCCQGGHVEATLCVPRQGFVPGESILFKATVQNESTGNLRHLRLILLQIVQYKAEKKVRRTKSEILAAYRGSVEEGVNVLWEDELKHIPLVIPSGLGPGCRLIDVQYQLHLMANRGISGKVSVILDLKIGTIPLRIMAANKESRI